MVTPSTRRAAAPTCRRCRDRGWVYLDAGADLFPYEVDCPACADPGDNDDPDGADDCRWADDVAESAPDDSSRWALVARHFPAAA